MPVTSATLSLVPNSATARSFSDAAKRSMNCVPTAVIERRTGAGEPAHQLADAERHAGGDDAGDGAVDRRRPTARRGRRTARRSGRRLGHHGHAANGTPAPVTACARDAKRTRNSARRPLERRAARAYCHARDGASTDGPATVLVVDDEPMVREVVARYLQRDGLRVHEAADGPSALAVAGRRTGPTSSCSTSCCPASTG